MLLSSQFLLVMTLSLGFLSACGTSQGESETSVQTVATSPSKPPFGIWHWRDVDFSSQRDVSVTRDGITWIINVDGESFSVEENENDVNLSLPSGERFNGKRTHDNLLTGTWFQPAGKYAYSSMATQFSLSAQSNNQWAGKVNLQPRSFHLFLDIFEDKNGKAKAVLRNPERNDILGATVFDLTRKAHELEDKTWQLTANRRGAKISIPLLFANDKTLQLEHFLVSGPVTLHRAKDEDLGKYYSRLQNGLAYERSAVKDLDDGWKIIDAEAAGFDTTRLDALVEKIATTNPRDNRPQLIHSLLVSYKSQLVMEEYFYGHRPNTVHDTRSLAKVFGSVMIGTAQQNGLDISPSYTPLSKIFQHNGVDVPENKSSLNLHSFLTYTSGLDTSEDSLSLGSENKLWTQRDTDFWLYTAQLPVLHPPGKRYAYSSASANMIGAALEQVTNMPVREFFHDTLAKPLEFSTYHWNLTPNDTSYLGGGVYMRPRDLLKIGALYAASGKWQGKQIVPKEWVSLSTTTKIEITAQTTGLSEEDFSNNYFGGGQAYIWQVNDVVAGSKVYTSFVATGNGGQMLVIVPELELAVGFTGGNYRMGSVWGRWRQQIVGEHIIPSLQNTTLVAK